MQRCHITAWQNNCGALATRGTTRDGQSVSDSFAYNNRSELTAATVSGESYAYDYDNIGNRETAQEGAEAVTAYATNSLNQYTATGDFTPTFDDAGNQTLVKTSTGIWAVTYDAENRPTLFSNADSSTTIECTYDYMGRRATKRVTVNGSVTLHQRYIYRGYLQIACCDLTRSSHPCLWLLTWDPTQTTATRPLAIQINGTWFTYGWDLTKNICEVYGQHGYIRTAYTYSPYGSVTMSGDLIQSIQWSSEYYDTELALVYYNYRHYNPTDGRWLGRDRLMEMAELNIYMSFVNNPLGIFDVLGEYDFVCDKNHRKWYKDFKMELYYKSLITDAKIFHVEDISNAIMDFMSEWAVDKVKEKIENKVKQSNWYRHAVKEFEDIIEAFERGAQRVNSAGIVGKIYREASFVCFRVKLQAKFCCCENGRYFFEKITSLEETQTYGHYLFSPEGFEMFELHLNELPKIYSMAIDELMSKGLNCCKK